MSKTDKTNPMWVQIMNGDCPVREVHNHENGVCEIKGMTKPDRKHIETFGDSCFFTWVWDGKNYGCGCKLCTMQYERKEERRKERRKWKRMLRR